MTETASNSIAQATGDGNTRTVAIVWSPQVSRIHDLLPSNPGRSTLVHTLLSALGLLSPTKHAHLCLIPPIPADPIELLRFHDPRYLHVIGLLAKGASVSDTDLSRAGLVHDSPPFRGLAAHVRLAAGGSLQAATFLTAASASSSPSHPSHPLLPRIAIHWDGGRHHAQRSSAAGFCYVNDIALAIDHLLAHTPVSPSSLPQHPLVYLDLDVHHGDGVEAAFRGNPRVATVSVHHFDPRAGYYPGTGAAEDADDVCALFDAMPPSGDTNWGEPTRGGGGTKKTKNWINVPLDQGCSDATLTWAVSRIVSRLSQGGLTHPRAVVVQCGADGLAGDPKGRVWSLSEQAYVRVLALVRNAWGNTAPVLVLGGGGYHHANTARAWAWVTAAALRLWDPNRVAEDKHKAGLEKASTAAADALLEGLIPETVPHAEEEEMSGLEAFGPLFEVAVDVRRGMRDHNVVPGDSGKIKGSVVRALDRAVDAVVNTCVADCEDIET